MKHSKSEIRRINAQTGGSPEDLRRELEEWERAKKAPKNPKLPTFTAEGEQVAQCLREIIDAGGVKATFAYAALSRFCALHVPGAYTGEQASVVLKEFAKLMAYACGLDEEYEELEKEEAHADV